MINITTAEQNRLDKFPELFGKEKFKNMPLYSYAERLFYTGMDQMVAKYSGGYFDFMEILEADVDIEKSGFIPLITDDGDVELVNHFGTTQTLSFKAASLVVWIYILEQIANNIENNTVSQRLYRTIEDIKYCHSNLINEEGSKVFTEEDCTAIYKLLN